MICDKCGKQNDGIKGVCLSCGTPLPQKSGGGGFADILSVDYTAVEVPAETTSVMNDSELKTEGISDYDMQKLIKKSDKIIQTTQKNTLFGLIAIGLSALIFISSIFIAVITVNKVKEVDEQNTKIMNQIQDDIDIIMDSLKSKENVSEVKKDAENKEDDKEDGQGKGTGGTEKDEVSKMSPPYKQDSSQTDDPEGQNDNPEGQDIPLSGPSGPDNKDDTPKDQKETEN